MAFRWQVRNSSRCCSSSTKMLCLAKKLLINTNVLFWYCFYSSISKSSLNKLNGILSHAFRYSTSTPRVWCFLVNNEWLFLCVLVFLFCQWRLLLSCISFWSWFLFYSFSLPHFTYDRLSNINTFQKLVLACYFKVTKEQWLLQVFDFSLYNEDITRK